MKKLALSMILGASLMVTTSAFALTAMTDSNMKSATGQAGVSIAVDEIIIETYTSSTSYIDDDGNGSGADLATSLVIGEKHVVKTYLGNTSEADYRANWERCVGAAAAAATPTQWRALTGADLGMGGARALTIDMGTCTRLTEGWNGNGGPGVIAGVIIGLPTLTIGTSADTYTVGIAQAGAHNDGDVFIRVAKGASAMAIHGGIIEIAPH